METVELLQFLTLYLIILKLNPVKDMFYNDKGFISRAFLVLKNYM